MATVDKNVAAAIFWMKARGGWREKPLPDEEADGSRVTVVLRQFTPAGDTVDEAGRSVAPRRIVRAIDHE